MFRENAVVMVLDLTRTSTDVLQRFRSSFRGRATIRVAKKTLAAIAAERAGRKALAELLKGLKVPVGFIATDVNPFRLKLEIDKGRILTPPKAGEKADIDVVVPPMNTGIPPGPILSEFGKMKIPTRIEGGTIWIAKETVVAKKGDELSPALASLLSKLDIPAVYRGLSVIVAVDGEVVIRPEDLVLDLEAFKKDLASGYATARALLIELGIPEPEVIGDILALAHRRAIALATETGYVTPETVEHVLRVAEARAQALARIVGA
jgi:large subunit ribosomal protein L10